MMLFFKFKKYRMRCYVTLRNIFLLVHTKMFIYYSLIKRLANYKVCLCFVVLSPTVCTVSPRYVCHFVWGQIFVDSASFLSMIFLKFYHYHDA